MRRTFPSHAAEHPRILLCLLANRTQLGEGHVGIARCHEVIFTVTKVVIVSECVRPCLSHHSTSRDTEERAESGGTTKNLLCYLPP